MSAQPSVTAYVEQERTPHVSSRLLDRTVMRYFLVILVCPVLGIFFPFLAERAPIIRELSASRWASILDYSYKTSPDNADVIIFGDSSALFGVHTQMLSSDLGMKVINLPGTMHSLPVTGDQPLRHYLSQNKAPQLIVLYVTAWNLDAHVHSPFPYEGVEQMIRHGGSAEILGMARHSPRDVMYFPLRFYMVESKFMNFLTGKPFQRPVTVMGHSENPAKSQLQEDCVLPERLKTPPDPRWIKALLAEFTSPNTKTMVYLAPLPNCVGSEGMASRRYNGLDVSAPRILPARTFADDTHFAHPLEDRIRATTNVFGSAVREALKH